MRDEPNKTLLMMLRVGGLVALVFGAALFYHYASAADKEHAKN